MRARTTTLLRARTFPPWVVALDRLQIAGVGLLAHNPLRDWNLEPRTPKSPRFGKKSVRSFIDVAYTAMFNDLTLEYLLSADDTRLVRNHPLAAALTLPPEGPLAI